MRICLICHFSSLEIRDKLALARSGQKIDDFAAWNVELISALSKRSDIELFVISPHFRMKKLYQKFTLNNVHYSFWKADIPIINRSWPSWFNIDACLNYFWQRKLVQHWIKKINPDVINLIGAENPHYSSMILGLRGFPIVVSIQGIYSNPMRFKSVKEIKWRSRIEKKVLAGAKYFGVNANFMPELISQWCDAPVFLWNRFPTKEIEPGLLQEMSKQEKKYDFVQFSGLTDLKGVPDTIYATKIVKEQYPNIKVRLFGRITDEYLDKIKNLISSLGMEDNVFISKGYRTVSQMLLEASRARFYILPTKIDTIPCTIFEALKIGLPVVSYRTGDIPLLNVGDDRVLLAEQNDITGLAHNMLRLLEENELGANLLKKASGFTNKYFSNQFNVNQFLEIYKSVYNAYHYKQPIPKSLLYDGFLNRRLKAEEGI